MKLLDNMKWTYCFVREENQRLHKNLQEVSGTPYNDYGTDNVVTVLCY